MLPDPWHCGRVAVETAAEALSLEAAKRAASRGETGTFWRLLRAAEDAAPVDVTTEPREARRA